MGGNHGYPACGFIGLGVLGEPIAQRIVGAGYPLIVWDMDPDRFAPFAQTKARIATNIAEVGAEAQHVGICVVNDKGVVAVCHELFPAMRPGSRIAIHSTISPETVKALAAEATGLGISMIDAPTTGVGGAAASGSLSVMVGGEKEAVAAAWPIFETFGELILHLGDVGSALPAKLIHNGLLAANMAMAHWALAAGESVGIDREAFTSLLKSSSGRSYGLELITAPRDPGGLDHARNLLLKDVHLLSEMMGDHSAAETMVQVALPYLEAIGETRSNPAHGEREP